MTSSIETESIATTDVVIDRATGSVETAFPFAGLMTVIRSNLGDTVAEAREAFGEDSVTETSFTVTNNNTGDTATFEGDLIVGASYTRSQTMAFPTSVAMLLSASLLGMFRGTVRDAVLDAIQSGVDGASSDEVGQAIMDAINLSPEALANGQQVLADMRRVSSRTVSAPVRFDCVGAHQTIVKHPSGLRPRGVPSIGGSGWSPTLHTFSRFFSSRPHIGET